MIIRVDVIECALNQGIGTIKLKAEVIDAVEKIPAKARMEIGLLNGEKRFIEERLVIKTGEPTGFTLMLEGLEVAPYGQHPSTSYGLTVSLKDISGETLFSDLYTIGFLAERQSGEPWRGFHYTGDETRLHKEIGNSNMMVVEASMLTQALSKKIWEAGMRAILEVNVSTLPKLGLFPSKGTREDFEVELNLLQKSLGTFKGYGFIEGVHINAQDLDKRSLKKLFAMLETNYPGWHRYASHAFDAGAEYLMMPESLLKAYIKKFRKLTQSQDVLSGGASSSWLMDEMNASKGFVLVVEDWEEPEEIKQLLTLANRFTGLVGVMTYSQNHSSWSLSPSPRTQVISDSDMEPDEGQVSKRSRLMDQEPLIEQEPSIEQEPLIEQEPSIEQEPLIEQEPSIEQAPLIEQELSIEQEPSTEQEPSIEQAPIIEQIPSIEEVPSIALDPISDCSDPSVQDLASDMRDLGEQNSELDNIPSLEDSCEIIEAEKALTRLSIDYESGRILVKPGADINPSLNYVLRVDHYEEGDLLEEESLEGEWGMNDLCFFHWPQIKTMVSREGWHHLVIRLFAQNEEDLCVYEEEIALPPNNSQRHRKKAFEGEVTQKDYGYEVRTKKTTIEVHMNYILLVQGDKETRLNIVSYQPEAHLYKAFEGSLVMDRATILEDEAVVLLQYRCQGATLPYRFKLIITSNGDMDFIIKWEAGDNGIAVTGPLNLDHPIARIFGQVGEGGRLGHLVLDGEAQEWGDFKTEVYYACTIENDLGEGLYLTTNELYQSLELSPEGEGAYTLSTSGPIKVVDEQVGHERHVYMLHTRFSWF